MSLNININKASKSFYPNQNITGTVTLNTPKALQHQGLKMHVEGSVTLQFQNSKSSAKWESMAAQLPTVELVDIQFDLEGKGKFPSGDTVIPFEFELKPTGDHPLYETYHGVYINIRYKVHVDLKRGFLSKDLKRTTEFIVQVPGQGIVDSPNFSPIDFEMVPKKLENVRKNLIHNLPDFHISGRLDGTYIDITQAFKGLCQVQSSQTKIKSIELQLVRVESCQTSTDSIKEATEIQNLQIGDGNVRRNFDIPIYMVPPRLFSCPTLLTETFKVQFEVNLIVLFRDGRQVTENARLRLFRRPKESENFESQAIL